MHHGLVQHVAGQEPLVPEYLLTDWQKVAAQFAGLAFLGIVLAVLVLRTRRLVPSVVTHMSFNGVAIAVLIAQRAGH